MGYEIYTTDQNFYLSKDYFELAYKAMCKLNDLDHLKRGGSFGGNGVSSKDPRPEGMSYHPAKWFSWMDANYPETCKTVIRIFEQLGFECLYDVDGNINSLIYSNKMGQEHLFLEAIAPYVGDGCYINWIGEDDSFWQCRFRDGVMTVHQGVIVFEDNPIPSDQSITNQGVQLNRQSRWLLTIRFWVRVPMPPLKNCQKGLSHKGFLRLRIRKFKTMEVDNNDKYADKYDGSFDHHSNPESDGKK